MSEVVITAIGRTPIGRAVKGSLIDERPDDLAPMSWMRCSSRSRSWPRPDRRRDLRLRPARRRAGARPGPDHQHPGRGRRPGTTVNRYCASSLQAVRMAFHAIKADEGSALVCAGVESSTRSPLGVFADQPETLNPRLFAGNREGLPEAYMSMGETAENVAESTASPARRWTSTPCRATCARSWPARTGSSPGRSFPVPLRSGLTMTDDDGPRADTTLERLAGLRTVFRKGGRVTAGNSCPLNDGAAAAVVMSRALAEQLGIEPIARILATGVSALEPELMGLGPIESSRQALGRAGMTIDDVDVVEINEAFAAQVIPSARASASTRSATS